MELGAKILERQEFLARWKTASLSGNGILSAGQKGHSWSVLGLLRAIITK
jgi:hypothetical protein